MLRKKVSYRVACKTEFIKGAYLRDELEQTHYYKFRIAIIR